MSTIFNRKTTKKDTNPDGKIEANDPDQDTVYICKHGYDRYFLFGPITESYMLNIQVLPDHFPFKTSANYQQKNIST
jgi:hypothetical protein